MEVLQQYIGELVTGSFVAIIVGIIGVYKALVARIKKVEETQIRQQGEINLNTALDKERAK